MKELALDSVLNSSLNETLVDVGDNTNLVIWSFIEPAARYIERQVNRAKLLFVAIPRELMLLI